MDFVVFKLSGFIVKVSAGNVFSFLQHRNCESISDGATLACYFSLASLVQLVPTSNSQISDVIFLNPNFTTNSSEINVQIMMLKDLQFLSV